MICSSVIFFADKGKAKGKNKTSPNPRHNHSPPAQKKKFLLRKSSFLGFIFHFFNVLLKHIYIHTRVKLN